MEAHLHQQKKAQSKTIASHDFSNWNNQKKSKYLDWTYFLRKSLMWLMILTYWIAFFPCFGRNELPCFSHHSGGAKTNKNKPRTPDGLQEPKRAQAQHQHNAFYSPKFQIHWKYTTTPFERSRNCSTFKFGGRMWNKTNLYLQDKVRNRKSTNGRLCIWLFGVNQKESSSS